jgi:hypothetical protein
MGVKQSKHMDISTTPKKNGEVNGKTVEDKITVTHFYFANVLKYSVVLYWDVLKKLFKGYHLF